MPKQVTINTEFLETVNELLPYEIEAVRMFIDGKIDFRHAVKYMDTKWRAEHLEDEVDPNELSPAQVMRLFSIVGMAVCHDLYTRDELNNDEGR